MQRALFVLDEAHAAHVGGEVIDDGRVPRDAAARLQILQVRRDILDPRVPLKPLPDRLDVTAVRLVWPSASNC